MSLETLTVMMGMASPQGQQMDQRAQGIQLISTVVLMVVVFYFIILRPQQKRAKEQRDLMGNLKAGDRILTNSGIIGVVISVKDKTVSLRSGDAKFEITKSAVAEITERGSENAAS